ncbi:MAG: C25 family peptidase propeptide domain-containing protein, partial [Nitrospirota bacterium]
MKLRGIPKNLSSMFFLVLSCFFVMASSALSSSELPKSKAKELTSFTSAVGFDYRGDIEPVPADIAVGITTGKYEITKKEYKTLDIKQKGEYIRMEGFHASTSSGDPMLPVRIYEIVVPPNIDWKTLKISLEAVETVPLPGQYDILPAPPLRARVDGTDVIQWGSEKDIVDGRNMKIYGKDRFFPEQPIKIVSHAQLRKWKFVKVEFSPVQYNPVKKSLQVIQSARVRLSFTRIGKESYRGDPLLDDKFFDEEAKSRFINFKAATEWYRYVPAPKSLKSLEADPDYVIITTNAIRDNSAKLTDFVNHKIAQGHSVGVVTEDDYGALVGQAPNGTAEKIRQWLINNYVPLGIHYVLLVGNPDPDDPAAPAD